MPPKRKSEAEPVEGGSPTRRSTRARKTKAEDAATLELERQEAAELGGEPIEADEELSPEETGPKALSVGEVVPLDIELLTDSEEAVALAKLVETTGLVVFLFPKAATPGCTTQAKAYRDSYESLTASGYDVAGLSGDSPKALASWKAKHDMPFKLLSDPEQKLTKVLGGSKTAKTVTRSHFVLEKGTAKLLLATIGVKPAESVTAVQTFITGLSPTESAEATNEAAPEHANSAADSITAAENPPPAEVAVAEDISVETAPEGEAA